MIYQVFLHKKAQKNLEKFPDRERIREHLLKLENFPEYGDLVRIDDAIYPLRIGDNRALFKVYEEEGMIVIVKIDVRGRIYSRFEPDASLDRHSLPRSSIIPHGRYPLWN